MKTTTAMLVLAIALSVSCKRSQPSGDVKPTIPGALPGADPYVDSLKQRIDKTLSRLGSDYVPRTKHLKADGSPQYTNRLIFESSPYLRQHAHNPVNWFPWGDEAFEIAKRLDRPVLLSVGYSTCHWCHVMEEESFEDVEIAKYMNEHYVAIKVDREERPDVDSLYMAAVHALRKRGGWPMTVWLTPDREPYFGGTYFPPRDGVRGNGRPGFLGLLQQLGEQYTNDPSGVAVRAGSVADAVEKSKGAPQPGTFEGAPVLHAAAAQYKQRFDSTHGGMVTRSTKFPSSLPIRFLLRYYRRTGDEEFVHMAALTLSKMAAGGMYDQVAGGFHRYSTDPVWLVPHFEKMLYDNAQLVPAYLEGYQVTGAAEFERTAREILRYTRRDMMSPQGAFYSATDADNVGPSGEREEGEFFTWTQNDVKAAVGDAATAEVVLAHYAVTAGGNFHELPGHTILSRPAPLAKTAADLGMTEEDARAALERAREAMYEFRKRRNPPLRDDKILAEWNGIMVSALARAHIVLGANTDGGPSYADQASRAAMFVLNNMRDGQRLLRTHNDGKAKIMAYLGDYAFMIQGLIDLFEATSNPRWLDEAIKLDKILEQRYEDKVSGGFFLTADDAEALLAREKPTDDGAIASGNSIHALNLLRLYELTTEYDYLARAEHLFAAFSLVFARSPTAMSQMLLAIDFITDTPKEIVVVAPGARDEAAAFIEAVNAAYVPNSVLVVSEEASVALLGQSVPLVKGKIAQRGQTTAYVCERQVCELPTRDPKVFAQQLKKVEALEAN
jgi:hypothetical protein